MERNRLCIHTMTTKPWTLEQAAEAYASAGVPAMTVWREHYTGRSYQCVDRILRDAGLRAAALCRGGFFPSSSSIERRRVRDKHQQLLVEAYDMGAPVLVLVCGAATDVPLETARAQIREGIEAILPFAHDAGVRLAVEPLHPMYADTRSAIITLRQANDLVETFDDPSVGVAIDVYHVWWDDTLEAEIARAGKSIFSFHVCDWRTPTRDLLNDRALMGEGCIPIRQIREWVDTAGFNGFCEVEIFSDEHWQQDQRDWLARIITAFDRFV